MVNDSHWPGQTFGPPRFTVKKIQSQSPAD
jgi:hypothetical protein